MQITRQLFVSYLHCKYKAYLELQGTAFPPHEYTLLLQQLDMAFREKAFSTLVPEPQLLARLRMSHAIPLDVTNGGDRLGRYHRNPHTFLPL